MRAIERGERTVGIVVLVLVAAGFLWLANMKLASPALAPDDNLLSGFVETTTTPAPLPATSTALSDQVPAAQSKSYTVEMNEQGFTPNVLNIYRGDTVLFVNKGQASMWPVSLGIAASGQICSDFDASRGIAPGATYRHTFTIPKTCPFHDRLSPSLTGIIHVDP